MAKLFSKTQPLVDPDAPAIDATIKNLEAHRLACTLEILKLERAGNDNNNSASPRESEIAALAAAYLGDEQPKPTTDLSKLYAQREAIDRALVVAGQRSLAAHGVIVASRCADRLQQWRDLARKRALAVATLRRLNRECDEFITDLASGGQRGGMPAEFPAIKLLGYGSNGADALRFLEAAVRAGIVTERDLQNA